jgi:uncharacterized membrane protein
MRSASKPAATLRKRSARLVRVVRLHIRLAVSALLGVGVFVGLMFAGHPERLTARFLIAWSIGAFCYLMTVLWLTLRSDLTRLRERAAEEDEGAALILLITVAAAVTSLVAIFAELGAAHRDHANWLAPVLALSTVLVSWFLIQAIYAIHYAHEFYGEAEGGPKGGLKFPAAGPDEGEKHPEYWDFIYFSFVIGMTFQVSDVQVTNKSLRRVVVGHGIVSFFYNVAVLALMVNLGSDFIKG